MAAVQTRYSRRLLWAAAILLPVLLIGIVFAPSVPLGEPGVWVWERILPFQVDFAGIFTAVLCCLVCIGAAWKLDSGKVEKKQKLLLAAVILLGGIWADHNILTSGRAGRAENALAILNPFTTGYLLPERSVESVTDGFVREVLTVPSGEVPHHRHVHPPANIYLAELAKALPGTWGSDLLPGVRRELDVLKKAQILIPPLDTPEMMEAALKLLILFFTALELGKILLAWLLWHLPGIRGRGLAVLSVALGGNSALLFLGHYDTFYFLISACVLATLYMTFRHPVTGGILSGVLTGIGGLFTLGFGAVGGLAGGVLLTGWRKFSFRIALGAFAATGIISAGILHLCGIHVWDIALKCWENQQLFQQLSGRSYDLWCALNVLDALLFCGVLPSLAILIPPGGRGHVWKMWCCALFFWLFILFSGGARGEFGRLAVVYLPVLLLILGIRAGESSSRRMWIFKASALALMFVQTALLREVLKLVLID